MGEGLPKYTDTAALALIIGHEVKQAFDRNVYEWKVIRHLKLMNGTLLDSVDIPGNVYE